MLKRFLILTFVISILGGFGLPALAVSCTYNWDNDDACDIVLNNDEIYAIRSYGPVLYQTGWEHLPNTPYYYCTPGTGTFNRDGVWGCKYTLQQTYSGSHTNSISVNGGASTSVLQDKAKLSAGFSWTNSTTVTTSTSTGTEAFLPEGKSGEWKFSKLYDYSSGYYNGHFYDMDMVWTSTGWHYHGSWSESVYRKDAMVTFSIW